MLPCQIPNTIVFDSRLSMHFEPSLGAHLVGMYVLYCTILSFFRPYDSMNRNRKRMKTWDNPLDRSAPMWNHFQVEQAKRTEQADDANNKEYHVVVIEDVDEVLETVKLRKNHLLIMKSSLSRLNWKVLPTTKALKLYTTLIPPLFSIGSPF